MNYLQFNKFCKAFPHASHVVQWGGAHVWKIGGKVFAIGGWATNSSGAITFKVSEMNFEMLREQPGLRPAPYLASRGLKWIQHYESPGLSDSELKECIRRSYVLVSQGLSKKRRAELGLTEDCGESNHKG